MTLGTLFVYIMQSLMILNFAMSVVYCKIKRLKFWNNAYFGLSFVSLVILAFIYLCTGICYLAENWDKVIF